MNAPPQPPERWKELGPLSKDDLSAARRLRRIKLYADEDIEEEVVETIRARGMNIVSARELGHRGKPDEFQLTYATKKKRPGCLSSRLPSGATGTRARCSSFGRARGAIPIALRSELGIELNLSFLESKTGAS